MNNKDNGLEGLTNQEKSIVALFGVINGAIQHPRSEEHTSELQSH